MFSQRVSSIRPPPVVRPPPSDGRPKNRLLAALPVDDFRRVLPDLTTISVHESQVLQEQGAPIDHETRLIPRGTPSAPPRILIVDPDADTRSLYRACLQLAGCDVVEASDGRDALVKALMHPPALVMTETRLPIYDGFALCEGLRRDVMTRTVPILVLTRDAGPAVVERARAAGADATLVNPSLDAVLNEIRRLLTPSAHLPRTSAPCGTTGAERSANPSAGLGEHRRQLAKAHFRFDTMVPPASPAGLLCPSCDRPLKYDRSHIGGVSSRHPEQWDDYTCPASCGTFQYRQRTRTLRNVS